MIRLATAADFPEVERMARRFEAASGLRLDPPGLGYCSEHFRQVVEGLIAHRLGLALVLETPAGAGLLLAAAAPSPFRPALWADEVIFWIDPPARGRWAGKMLDRYEAWAADLGATITGLSALDARTGRLFLRRGYRPAERKFLKGC